VISKFEQGFSKSIDVRNGQILKTWKLVGNIVNSTWLPIHFSKYAKQNAMKRIFIITIWQLHVMGCGENDSIIVIKWVRPCSVHNVVPSSKNVENIEKVRFNLGFRNRKRQLNFPGAEEFSGHFITHKCVPLAFGQHPRTQMNTSATNFVIDPSVLLFAILVFLFLLGFFRTGLFVSIRFVLLVIILLGSPTH